MPDNELHPAPVVALPPIADLTQAAMLKNALLAALAAGEGLTLDAGAVVRVTSPCLQVLCAGMRAFAEAGGPPLRIAGPSEAFAEAARTLALAPLLELEG